LRANGTWEGLPDCFECPNFSRAASLRSAVLLRNVLSCRVRFDRRNPVHGLQPQVVASRMKVDPPSIGPPDVEYVEGVRIKSPAVAGGALTAQALTMLLRWNCYRSLNCSRETPADL